MRQSIIITLGLVGAIGLTGCEELDGLNVAFSSEGGEYEDDTGEWFDEDCDEDCEDFDTDEWDEEDCEEVEDEEDCEEYEDEEDEDEEDEDEEDEDEED